MTIAFLYYAHESFWKWLVVNDGLVSLLVNAFFCGLILTPIIVWIKHRVSAAWHAHRIGQRDLVESNRAIADRLDSSTPGGITDLINAVKGAPMQSYSCSVKVVSVQGEDFGATANLVYVDGGGIDISFAGETIAIQITEDAAEIVQTGALLTLTISKP